MKTFTISGLISLLLLAHTLFSQTENQLSVPLKADKVTVFLSGAEIESSMDVPLKKGRNLLVFTGLPHSLQEGSIQLSNDGNLEIFSVATDKYQIKREDADPEYKKLLDTISIVSHRIQLLNNQLVAYEMEKSTLDENQRLSKNSMISIADLSKAADFFRERTLKISNATLEIGDKIKVLNEKLETLKSESAKANVDINRKTVTILLSSAEDRQVHFTLQYLASDAKWSAFYDLIATDISKPVVIKYKARIYNNTGAIWDKVKLTLSTGNPALAATRPQLTAWNLNYDSSPNEGLVDNKAKSKTKSISDSTASFDLVNVSELSTAFEIPQHYTIASSPNPYSIEITSGSLNATYEYLTVPKVELSAYLIAKVTGWERMNLIDGPANIYFGTTYLGESAIDTRLISDTLELSLGRDNQVVVSRSKVEDHASSSLIGFKRTESFLYEIEVKNKRKTPINIKIQDQVPISQESDITVDIEEVSKAELDVASGRLQWVTQIAPGEVIQQKVAFSVRYPKNKHVNIRKRRVVRTPRFRA